MKKFSKLDSKDFQAASANRLAFTFMNMNEWTDALKELKMAEELEQKLDSRSEILSSTYNFKGKCLAEGGDKARVLAGVTDLIVQARERKIRLGFRINRGFSYDYKRTSSRNIRKK